MIIDTKFYAHATQSHYERQTLHSANLYQIYTYVKNQDKGHTGKVSGILLYAKTQEQITPDCEFQLGGNRIGAATLDLNRPFAGIAEQLDGLVERYL